MTRHWVLIRDDGSRAEQVYADDGAEPVWSTGATGTAHEADRFGEPWEFFDPATGWQPDMAKLRAIKWEAVKAKRAAVQLGGCQTPSGRVQIDLESRGLISGAVQLAMLAVQAGQPFALVFTLADNSSVTLNAADMIALGTAVGSFIGLAHAHSVTLRAAIDAAADKAALDAIDIQAGWPA